MKNNFLKANEAYLLSGSEDAKALVSTLKKEYDLMLKSLEKITIPK